MFRRLVAFTLTACLCLQALAFAGVDVVMAQDEEHEHAILHFAGVAHEHHDHGDHDEHWHEGESPEAVGHVVADEAVFSPVLLTIASIFVAVLPGEPPEIGSEQPAPDRYPDGLERPPRLTA